jgi:ABC-type dipeptide transport system, periplasmic component
MSNRTFTSLVVRSVVAAGLGLAASVSLAQAESVLRFVPHGDLVVVDPILNIDYMARNHGYMIYDTLFAFDSKNEIKPQMVDTWTVSEDGMSYSFKLRPGLKWHDGTPVRAADCVASLERWGKRDSMGIAMFAALESIKTTGEDTFEIKLAKPFGHVLAALGKTGSNVPFMMPERVARTDPFASIEDSTGSGPFYLAKDEWVPGSKIVYRKFEDYVPREEPADFLAGGKVAKVDRIEWTVMPDGATAVSALANGEVDWVEVPPADLLPMLAGNEDLVIRSTDPFGIQTMLRFNHMHPPFNNAAIRKAVMATVSQQDFMQVTSGEENTEVCVSFFVCGTRFATEAGAEGWLKAKDLEKAKALLAEGGYNGEKVIVLDPTDDTVPHNQTIVAVANLREIGMNVEVRATDAGSLFALAGNKEPGAWHLFVTWADATNYSVPTLNNALRAGGEKNASVGWPVNDRIQDLRNQFLAAFAFEEQKTIAAAIQEEAYKDAIYVLTGQYKQATAYSSRVEGMIDSPIPVMWNISVAE